jgi:exosome complex RNA-binding protein Rrp42 (RNase PH superfamily)
MAERISQRRYAVAKPSRTPNLQTTVFLGSISTADGSALVRLGDTTIICGVKAEIAEPELDRPEEGFLGKSLSSVSLSYLS